ncbi:glycosyltransferase family 2 protein [Muricauda sp. 334s03]|uniref:Glycosyltransferase family 2 protein n=1 Tax=Flagellimonas yonaguniensis TaxID=3031325 RepID=A0ABT5XUB4_9FLAO|nr:glycosyltransferase family 2 protein [[Muricauda] yonaguniensis]MDF0714772.1 glycosyltransferase family 2 protein [[Muricauda] yonaguniensis]
MDRVCAVVVTYNRLELLKETLNALLEVNGSLEKVVVVNNASTDNTHEYLQGLSKESPKVEEYLMKENLGGAGGFKAGLKYAFEQGYDYIWLMDDDSIVKKDSLGPLLEPFKKVEDVGFTCSKVIWTDGTPHKMNIPDVSRVNDNGVAFFGDEGYINVKSCSFVSMMVPARIVDKLGLPYQDFFIWCDDLEYSRRIIRAGYKGLFVEESQVVHKTVTNHNTNIQNCTPKEFWKMEYGFRNRTFMHRKFGEYNLMFLFFARNLYRSVSRKNHKLKAFSIVVGAFFKGIFFKPTA